MVFMTGTDITVEIGCLDAPETTVDQLAQFDNYFFMNGTFDDDEVLGAIKTIQLF